VLLVTGIWALGSFTFFTYVSFVLRRAANIGGGLLALFLLLYGVCGVAGSIAAGRFSDRAGARATLVVALSLTASALLGLGVLTARGAGGGTAELCGCAGLLALYAVGTWAVAPPQQHRLIGLGGESRFVLGLNASVLYAGVALGGAAGGLIVGSGGGAAMLCWIAAAIDLAALAVLQVPDSLLAARKRAGRPPAPRRLIRQGSSEGSDLRD
jgi:predicted MFS family arabinose efflux permease